jgi:hypothetical protein
MKKIILSVSLCSCLFATVQSDNIIEASAGGKRIVTETGNKYIHKKVENQYKDEVLFNYIIANRNINEKAYQIKNRYKK